MNTMPMGRCPECGRFCVSPDDHKLEFNTLQSCGRVTKDWVRCETMVKDHMLKEDTDES